MVPEEKKKKKKKKKKKNGLGDQDSTVRASEATGEPPARKIRRLRIREIKD